MLVVTHDHRLEPYADRVLVMADGKLKTDATPDTTVMFHDDPTIELTPIRDQDESPRLRLKDPVFVTAE